MNLKELADLVVVRNQLNTIVSSSRAPRQLLKVVADMDKLFLEECGRLDLSKLDERSMTVVRVAGNPSKQQLEEWRQLFEQSKKDKDFSVFTHSGVSVQQYKLAPDEAIRVQAMGEVKVMPTREIIAESGQLSMNFAEKPTEEESKAIENALKKLHSNVKVEPEGAVAVAKEVIKEKKPVDDKQLAEEIAKDHAAEDARLAELKEAEHGVEQAVGAIEQHLNSEELQQLREEQEKRDAEEIAKRLAKAKAEIPPDAVQPTRKGFRRSEEPE